MAANKIGECARYSEVDAVLKFLFWFNAIFAILFVIVGSFGYLETLTTGPLGVTELDRHGVFNEEALKAYRPDLATNLRYNVGMYLTEDLIPFVRIYPVAGFAITMINAVTLFYFCYFRKAARTVKMDQRNC